MFNSQMRLLALLSARSFILFSERSSQIVGELHLSVVYQSDIFESIEDNSKLITYAIFIKLNLFAMTVQASKWLFSENAQPSSIKPLKPLVFNFFISHTPEAVHPNPPQHIEHTYQTLYSQRLAQSNPHSFRPTITFKKMLDEHKFRLSVQRKKNKLARSSKQAGQQEKMGRKLSRGSKIRVINKEIENQQERRPYETIPQRIEVKEISYCSPKKGKDPHFQFNLNHILKTNRTFTGQFNRSKHIQGSNFPFYQYFSSEKSSIPKTQKTARSRTHKEKERLVATTTGLRHFQFDI